MTNEERAEKLAFELNRMPYLDKMAQMILAHDDVIKRECDTRVQDTLTICGVHKEAGIRSMLSKAILGTEPARGSLPETKTTGGANTLSELISLLEIARDNKTGISLDWVETGIALRNLTEPARE